MNRYKSLILIAFGLVSITATASVYCASYLETNIFNNFHKETQAVNIENDIASGSIIETNCKVVVAGGGAGGIAAAIQSARLGVDTCLVEETNWLGGMLTASGVSSIDGRPDMQSGLFKEFIDRVRDYYKKNGLEKQISKCSSSYLCFEPHVGAQIFSDMVKDTKNLKFFLNSRVINVYRDGNTVKGVKIENNENETIIIPAKVTIDATNYGDLMEMGKVPYDLGYDQTKNEKIASFSEQCIQPLTYVAILKKDVPFNPVAKPANYDEDNYKCVVKNEKCPDSNSQFDIKRLLTYGNLPNNKLMLNIPSHSYGNDFNSMAKEFEDKSRDEVIKAAKNYTLGLVYFLQTQLNIKYSLYNEFNSGDSLALQPYVRESRRLIGIKRLTENDILSTDRDKRPSILTSTIAVGDYPIDLHFCTTGIGDIYIPLVPYQIPYEVIVPMNIDGFLVAEKNISVSHVVNGTTRLQPVVMNIGQASGAAAALTVKYNTEPRFIDVAELQRILLNNKVVLYFFKDVDPSSYTFVASNKLALKGIIHGYSDLSLNINANITTTELKGMFQKVIDKKIVSLNWQNKTQKIIDLLDEYNRESIKRNDFAKIMADSFYGDSLEKITDKDMPYDDVSPFDAYKEIGLLKKISIFNVDQTKFRPHDWLKRGEAFAIISRLYQI